MSEESQESESIQSPGETSSLSRGTPTRKRKEKHSSDELDAAAGLIELGSNIPIEPSTSITTKSIELSRITTKSIELTTITTKNSDAIANVSQATLKALTGNEDVGTSSKTCGTAPGLTDVIESSVDTTMVDAIVSETIPEFILKESSAGLPDSLEEVQEAHSVIPNKDSPITDEKKDGHNTTQTSSTGHNNLDLPSSPKRPAEELDNANGILAASANQVDHPHDESKKRIKLSDYINRRDNKKRDTTAGDVMRNPDVIESSQQDSPKGKNGTGTYITALRKRVKSAAKNSIRSKLRTSSRKPRMSIPAPPQDRGSGSGQDGPASG